jgi:predicted ester cyclase
MGVIHGVEGARKMLTMLLQAFPDLKYEIEELIPSGDRVVVRSLLSGTHRGTFAGIAPTSKQVTWRSCVVVEFRNGKAVRSRTYADNLSLLQQLGAISLPRAAGA